MLLSEENTKCSCIINKENMVPTETVKPGNEKGHENHGMRQTDKVVEQAARTNASGNLVGPVENLVKF